jgi:hypothetical protein
MHKISRMRKTGDNVFAIELTHWCFKKKMSRINLVQRFNKTNLFCWHCGNIVALNLDKYELAYWRLVLLNA